MEFAKNVDQVGQIPVFIGFLHVSQRCLKGPGKNNTSRNHAKAVTLTGGKLAAQIGIRRTNSFSRKVATIENLEDFCMHLRGP